MEKKELQTKFGEFIRMERLKNHIGLRKFAEMVGISATYISKMEIGDYAPPSEEKVKKMADILKKNHDELLAMAGKVSSDLQKIILREPKLYASFLRKAKKSNIKGYLGDIEKNDKS